MLSAGFLDGPGQTTNKLWKIRSFLRSECLCHWSEVMWNIWKINPKKGVLIVKSVVFEPRHENYCCMSTFGALKHCAMTQFGFCTSFGVVIKASRPKNQNLKFNSVIPLEHCARVVWALTNSWADISYCIDQPLTPDMRSYRRYFPWNDVPYTRKYTWKVGLLAPSSMFFQKTIFFEKKFFLAKNHFWTFPMTFSQKIFFQKNLVFWKKHARWRQ